MRARLAAAIPPALLVIVAVGQLVVSLKGDLTPWKGGGFGMFAAIDARSIQSLGITAGSDTVYLDVASAVDRRLRLRILTAPTRANLQDVASRLLTARWQSDGVSRVWVVATPSSNDRPSAALASLSVAVHEVRFDPRTDTASRVTLRQIRVRP